MEANREEPADGVIAKQYARFVSSLEPILSYLFGDDIFISYARTDTTAYAAALARHLTARNYSCYLDQWTTRPGTDLPAELLKAVRRSGIFVLLASAAATKSEAIKREVAAFKPTHRPFILVALSDEIGQAVWYDDVMGAATTIDAPPDPSGPSQAVIERIADSFKIRRRNQRLKRASAGVLTSTAAVLLLGYLAADQIVSSAVARRNEAVALRTSARREAFEASEKAVDLEINAVIAEARAARAEHKEAVAVQSADIAEALRSRALAMKDRNLAEALSLNAENGAADVSQILAESVRRGETIAGTSALAQALPLERPLRSRLPMGKVITELKAGLGNEFVVASFDRRDEQGAGAVWDGISGGRKQSFTVGPSGSPYLRPPLTARPEPSVSGGDNGCWSIEPYSRPALKICGLTGPLNQVAANSNGARIAVASRDQYVRIYGDGGRLLRALPCEDEVKAVAFSPDDRWVAAVNFRKVTRVWNVEDGAPIARLYGGDRFAARSFFGSASSDGDDERFAEEVYHVTFGGQGRLLAVAADETAASVWDMAASGLSVMTSGFITDWGLFADGELLITAEQDATRIRDAHSLALRRKIPVRNQTVGRLIGHYYVSGASVWDIDEDRPVDFFAAKQVPHLVAISWNQRLLASADETHLHLWDLPSKSHVRSYPLVQPAIFVDFAADDRHVEAGSSDDSTRILDLDTHTWLPDGGSTFSTESGILVVRSNDGSVRKFGGHNGHRPSRFQGWSQTTPDGAFRILQNGWGRNLLVSDVNHATVRQLDDKTFFSHAIFSPDGRYLAASGRDKKVRVWECDSRTGLLKGPIRLEHAGFSDPKRMATNRRALGEAPGLLGFPATAGLLATSMAGKLIIWDLAKQQVIRIYPAGSRMVWSPDGESLWVQQASLLQRLVFDRKWLLEWSCKTLSFNLPEDRWKQLLPLEPFRKTCPGLP